MRLPRLNVSNLFVMIHMLAIQITTKIIMFIYQLLTNLHHNVAIPIHIIINQHPIRTAELWLSFIGNKVKVCSWPIIDFRFR